MARCACGYLYVLITDEAAVRRVLDFFDVNLLKTRLEEVKLSDDLAEFARKIIFGVLPLT